MLSSVGTHTQCTYILQGSYPLVSIFSTFSSQFESGLPSMETELEGTWRGRRDKEGGREGGRRMEDGGGKEQKEGERE